MKYLSSLAAVLVLGLAAMFAFAPTPAKAVMPVFDMGLLTNTVSQDANVKSEERRALSSGQRFPGGQRFLRPDPSANAPMLPESVLRYNYSRARTQQNFASFVEKSRRIDPQGAANLEANFASVDLMPLIAQSIEPYGLSTTNLADAYAAWWMTAWNAAFNPGADITRPQAQAVRRQSANAMLVIPEFGNLTDAQKQELAEAYLVQAVIIDVSIEQAGGDPDQLRAVAAAVKQGAVASGMNLEQMTLTPGGFQPR